jgi:MoxR-like ATPase
MLNQEQAAWFADTFAKLVTNVERAVLGKRRAVQLTITCLLSEGHLLIEDVPGTGKTSLARALANTVKGTHSRIQFTPDLLPSDVTGVTIYNERNQQFEFREGPIFATIVLADEINRASPKTQAALLEVMEEGQVTVNGESHAVGPAFMVVATQNPIELAGTYPLPEAQLDRFLIRTHLGHPDHETTIAILTDASIRDRASAVQPIITVKGVTEMAKLADQVYVDPGVLSYVSRLAEETRRSSDVALGVSVRACLALVRAAKTWAASQGRTWVAPDDIKELAWPVFGHRMVLTADARFSGVQAETVLSKVTSDVAPPTERGAA